MLISKHKVFWFLCALLVAGGLLLNSCATAPAEDAGTEEVQEDTPTTDGEGDHFLWEIQGGTGKLHIFGSIHLATSDVYPLPEFIYDIFESSDSLILEVNIAEAGPDAFFGAQSLMEYPDGQSLENDLSESEIELLTDILGKLGIPFDMVKHLKPWVIEATLVTTLAQQHGIQAEYGIDMHFAELAEDLDMPVIALETIEEQLNLLGSLDTETQAAQLMRSVENYQDISEYVQELLQIWRNGDLQGMEDSIAESLLSDPELQPYYESMFTRRNHAWARTLIEELETPGDSFVVVGSGHLVGPENVIEILRDAGYQAVRF